MRTFNLKIALAAVALALATIVAGTGLLQAQTPPAAGETAPPAAKSPPAAPIPAPAAPPAAGSPPAQAQPATPQEKPQEKAQEKAQETAPGEPAAPQESATIAPIQLPERPALILRGKAKWDDGFKEITGAFSKLRAEIDKTKLKPVGHPLAVFVESDDDGFTYEAMIPLESEPAAETKFSEGVKAGKNPGGKALKFEHRAAYDEIESTYEAIAAYLDEKGLAAKDELIEEFIKQPPGSDDQAAEIDIYVLLKE